ncbi:N-acetyltransferase GCN5 [Actinobacillus pleuropneumoniae]|nr:N-acetyltransferase GCN5 [Actinobacillus pleuropneumoniae]
MHAPELLSEQHIVRYFQCGEVVLDQWLQRTALKNQQNNASKNLCCA